jgi:hypothetical protein
VDRATVARIISERGEATDDVGATGRRRLLPIPLVPEPEAWVGFLSAPASLQPGVGSWVLPPDRMKIVSAKKKKQVWCGPVDPRDFGFDHKPDKFLGAFTLPPGMTAEQYRADEARYYELYDKLLPIFGRGETCPEADARELKAKFARLAEPPLLPYYHAAGEAWFAWLQR